MIIISLSGKAGSGKDTVADIIRDIADYKKFLKVGFADEVYNEVAVMLKTCDRRLFTKSIPEIVSHIKANKPNYRLLLQWWGTDFRRNQFGDTYWIKKLLVKLADTDADIVVVNDCRFRNEYDALKEGGAHMWRINRNIATIGNHPSETDVDGAEFEMNILNNSSLSILRDDIAMCLIACNIPLKTQ